MIDQYVQTWSKWFDYKGRASQGEFWVFTVITWCIFAAYVVSNKMVAAVPVDKGDNVGIALSAITVITLGCWALSLPPQLSVASRRLNDANLSPLLPIASAGYFFLVHEHWSRWIAIILLFVMLAFPRSTRHAEA